MTGVMTALVGLGAILAVATLVWMLSVRLRGASIADIFWGLGFVQLAWLYCVLSPTLTEDGLKASQPGYRDYIARTPAFFPWFARVPR